MNFYTIREPKTNEIHKSILTMLRSFNRPFFDHIKKERDVWLYLLKNKIAKFLIAVKNDNVLGVGGLFMFQDAASIGYMGVLPEFRSQGIGSDIFQKLMDIALNASYKTINLYASKLGEPIYRKYGFRGSYYANMYSVPITTPITEIKEKNIKVISRIPNWVLDLDRETVGFDRSVYLKARVSLRAKLLIRENQGYGLISNILSNIRLGPVLAINQKTAVDIIKKGISLGAESIIIPNHPFFQKEVITLTGLTNKGDPNLKMVYGEEVTGKLSSLYAIGTYAKG
ncbi:MAG: GNAT family N-acetyltransferase [Candidatus Hermodarchaeota archaeon]